MFDCLPHGVIWGGGDQIWYFSYAWARPRVTARCFPQLKLTPANQDHRRWQGWEGLISQVPGLMSKTWKPLLAQGLTKTRRS